MELNELTPGCQIDICRKHGAQADETTGKKEIMFSRLYDLAKSGDIIIHMPTKDGRDYILRPNVTYELIFVDGEKIFEMDAMVIKVGKMKRFQVVLLKPLTSLVKVQRRNYFRLECSMPLSYMYIEESLAILPSMSAVKETIKQDPKTMRIRGMGTILDISGGGLRFISTQSVEDIEYMLLQFTLQTVAGAEMIEVVARIVRSQYIHNIEKYEHRMQFLFRENDDREKIIKYIFDEERRIRKKVQG